MGETTNAFKALPKCLIAVLLLVDASGLRAQPPGGKGLDSSDRDKQRLARFEKQADELRAQLKIPGMSAVIVKDQKVLWAKGFGFADLENRTPATPETLYHIASLTKTFAATLLMQLVEQGKLDLDEPMSRYSSDFKDDSVKIKHLLSHTSDGTPGERYRYDGNRYNHLTAVIEKKTGKSFRAVMVETFLGPLAMASSVPGHDVVDEADKWGPLLGKDHLSRYVKNLSRLSQPYTLYGDSETVHVPYPPKGLGASAGLLSTVLDMAQYDAAIDRHRFLKTETQEKAWTAFVSNGGQRLPHGLGWFVTEDPGIRLVWHYGNWGTGFSAIYLKVPERHLSLVMLANSEALGDHHFPAIVDRQEQLQVGAAITNNVFACSFLRLFVLDDVKGHDCERTSQIALAKWLEQRRAQARVPIQVGPGILEPYVGQYQFEAPSTRVLTVSREGSRLFVNIPSNEKSELFAESESKFFLKVRPVQLTFIKEEGQVTYLEHVFANMATTRAKKVK
jgi:CubicO group peptidase (beta-lactamase class C family)